MDIGGNAPLLLTREHVRASQTQRKRPQVLIHQAASRDARALLGRESWVSIAENCQANTRKPCTMWVTGKDHAIEEEDVLRGIPRVRGQEEGGRVGVVLLLDFGASEPPSLRLTGTHSRLAFVQARRTGMVWGKALALLVARPARLPTVRSVAAAQGSFQRWWASSLSTLAHVKKCWRLRRTARACDGRSQIQKRKSICSDVRSDVQLHFHREIDQIIHFREEGGPLLWALEPRVFR